MPERRRRSERERAEREGETYTPPEKPNPFKYNLSARGEINPEDNVTISFRLSARGDGQQPYLARAFR